MRPSPKRVALKHRKIAGFFSYECLGCGRSLLSENAASKDFKWMSDVVAVFKNPIDVWGEDQPVQMVAGEYDGYGRIEVPLKYGSEAIEISDEHPIPSCWHHRCWKKAGSPKRWVGSSPGASDQGWFFDDADYEGTIPGRRRASHDIDEDEDTHEEASYNPAYTPANWGPFS